MNIKEHIEARRTRGWSLEAKLAHWSIPEPNSGCLLWLSDCNEDGYGMLWWDGRMQGAHRLSWERVNGPLAPGMRALHKCDVRCCINDAHLFAGTQGDNVADMVAKGRNRPPIGEAHPGARLTAEDVRFIRSSALLQDELAARFGVNRTAISKVRNRISWRHLP